MMTKLLLTLLLLVAALPAWAQTAAPPAAPTTHPYEIASNDILENLHIRYSDSRGPNLVNVFTVLGALAGYGSQMSIREGLVRPGIITLDQAFVVVNAPDGEKYYFGNFLNTALLGGEKAKTSVWSLVAGAAQQAGAKTLPDVEGIATYNVKTVGTPDFGIPRLPPKYTSALTPLEALKRNWPAMLKILQDDNVDPKIWGWTFALAANKLILSSKTTFDPGMAADIVMESAMPMSKIDPQSIIPKVERYK